MTRHTFKFRFLLRGPELDHDLIAQLVAAGCDDAVFGVESGLQVADFDRESTDFEDAVLSAIDDVERSAVGLAVMRVEPDDLVTAGGIAERTGRTRQSVSLLIKGDRRHGGFPTPLTTADGRARIWHWSEVAEWLGKSTPPASVSELRLAHFVAAVNGALEKRRHLSSYERHGGASRYARMIDRLSNEPRSEVSDPHFSLTPGLIEVDLYVRRPARPRDAFEHLVDIEAVASLMAELWEERGAGDLAFVPYIEQAVTAHRYALALRWQGQIPAALSCDQQVISHAAEMLRRFRTASISGRVNDDRGRAEPTRDIRLQVTRNLLGPAHFRYGEQRRDVLNLVGCVEFVGERGRSRTSFDAMEHALDAARSLEEVDPVSACYLLAEDGWQQGASRVLALQLSDLSAVEHAFTWPQEMTSGSLAPFYASSWTLVHALRRMAREGLPEALPRIEEAVERFDREFAELFE